jgi:Peptidase A4 family
MNTAGLRRRTWRIAGGLVAAGVMAGWAVLGLAGPASAVTPSGGWYGYAVTGATYTSTTADWTMPAVNCAGTPNAYIAIWTGLDGYSSASVEQIGAQAYCSAGTAEYIGWYELYPAAAVDFSNTLKPGDSLQASVSYASSKFTLTLRDVTRGWTQTVTKALSGAERSSAETIVQVSPTFICPTPATLAAFTGDTVDGSALGSLHPVEVTGGGTNIVVSPVSGKTFTVSCRPEA